jgi:hypothetical protein
MTWRGFLDMKPRIDELEHDVLYHEAQQRMVNAHFEKWRTPEEPTPWRDRDILLRGVLGSCVSFSIPD